MFKRTLVSVILMFAFNAQAKECTNYEAYAADSVTDYLNSWENFHLAYTEFSHCDDGGVGERLSENVARLFVDQWKNLNQYVAFASKDKKFEEFVLLHIDSTLNEEDLEKINLYSKTKCQKSFKKYCNKLQESSEAALKESRGQNAT